MRLPLILGSLTLLLASPAHGQGHMVPLHAVVADSAGLAEALRQIPAAVRQLPPAQDSVRTLYHVVYDSAGKLDLVQQAIQPDAAGSDSAVVRVLREHLAATAAPDAWTVLRASPGEAEPLGVFVPQELWPGSAARGIARPRDGRAHPLP